MGPPSSRGNLVIEIALRPFSVTVRRSGRRLLRSAGFWAAVGTAADQFVQLTEGVVPHEDLGPPQRALSARIDQQGENWVALELGLHGGGRAWAGIEIEDDDQVTFEFDAGDEPLRLALRLGPSRRGTTGGPRPAPWNRA